MPAALNPMTAHTRRWESWVGKNSKEEVLAQAVHCSDTNNWTNENCRSGKFALGAVIDRGCWRCVAHKKCDY